MSEHNGTKRGKPGEPEYTEAHKIPPDKQLLDVGEVALLIGVEVHTVRRYYRLHGLPSVRRGPQGPRLFDRQAVVAWWHRFCVTDVGRAERKGD